MPHSLAQRIGSTAFAFRGYNVTNLGRSQELMKHAAYGPIVRALLGEASDICAETVGRKVDLVGRVERGEETSLETYDEAVALIVAVELAQIKLLDEFFGVRLADAKMAFGYSLGELTALVACGVYAMGDVLRVPLSLAADCVALAEGVTMGIVFSRGPSLEFDDVERLCLRINAEGDGVIGVSSFLAPNAVLLLGQGTTIQRFRDRMRDALPERAHLRKNADLWPPMHTPIVWQRNLPNRVGQILHTLPGGFQAPVPPILSLVTGSEAYNDFNSRDILVRWIDHPQRLWDAVYETLSARVEMVVHVGPAPNLIPATFHRLRDNVEAQLAGNSINRLGMRAISHVIKRPWLASLLPSRTALLRAPLVGQIILEDWLLEQPVP